MMVEAVLSPFVGDLAQEYSGNRDSTNFNRYLPSTLTHSSAKMKNMLLPLPSRFLHVTASAAIPPKSVFMTLLMLYAL